MEDVAPILLEKIEKEFREIYDSDNLIMDLAKKLKNGTATHTEAYEYADRVGEILTNAYQNNISSEKLPLGKLWYNIANRVITPTMQNNYEVIEKYVSDVQATLNQAAGVGIKVMQPDIDVEDRIKGIVNRVAEEEYFDDVKWILKEPVKTFGRNIVDESIKANVSFHGKAGLQPKIIRKTSGNCCNWCSGLVGTYTYPDVPENVYRRHDNCKCTVNYDPGNGKVQSVHTGQEGKRRYVKNEYGVYEKRKEERIAYAKNLKINEDARRMNDREQRIRANQNKNFAELKKGKDVTAEYKDSIKPAYGNIQYERRYNDLNHDKEIEMAHWIHRKLGGDITLLTESDVDGVMRPDFLWNDKYWELKSVTTEKAANSAIRKGLKQIRENPGGIILHYENEVDLQETIKVIEKRVDNSKESDISFDIMIVQGEKMIKVIRY